MTKIERNNNNFGSEIRKWACLRTLPIYEKQSGNIRMELSPKMGSWRSEIIIITAVSLTLLTNRVLIDMHKISS